MRTLLLASIGLGLLLTALPARTIQAQHDGGIARLTSEAYAPDSPVRENRLFQYQTGHYGFAYNCDGEECKRNNPAICWRKADQCQLPERMGCLERIRHEAAQVRRRILDGACASDCEVCQQSNRQPTTRSCGCGNCLANQHKSAANSEIASVANVPAEQPRSSGGQRLVDQSKTKQAVSTVVAAEPVSKSRRRSGLVSLTPFAPVPRVELNPGEVLIGEVKVVPTEKALQPPVEFVPPPVARITSASVGLADDSVDEVSSKSTKSDFAEASQPPATNRRMSLIERLKKAQTAKAADSSEPKNF